MNIIENPPQRIKRPQHSPPVRQSPLILGKKSIQHPIRLDLQSSKLQKKLTQKNNNQIPFIQTPFITSRPVIESQNLPYTFSKRNDRNIQTISSRPINISNQKNHLRVSFSYDNKPQNVFYISQNLNPKYQSLQKQQSVFFSIDQNRKISNLSKFSQNFRTNNLFESQKTVQRFHKQKEAPTILKLGKKPKFNNKFSQNINLAQKNRFVSNNEEQENHQLNAHDMDKSLANLNISKILPHQKSQFIYIPNEKEQKSSQKIDLMPQSYVFSEQKILVKRSQKINSTKNPSSQTINIPIQEQIYSRTQLQMLQKPLFKKINNKTYIEGQNEPLGQLRKIQDKISRIAHKQKSSKVSHSQKSKSQQPNQTENIKNKQDKSDLLLKQIQNLKKSLKEKQQQNKILKVKLQNKDIQQKVQKEYETLQITSKLNQIEIKKLQNQLKMFKIKEKMFQNKQQEYITKIKELKMELKLIQNTYFNNIDSKESLRRREKYY